MNSYLTNKSTGLNSYRIKTAGKNSIPDTKASINSNIMI